MEWRCTVSDTPDSIRRTSFHVLSGWEKHTPAIYPRSMRFPFFPISTIYNEYDPTQLMSISYPENKISRSAT
jgi:hypothetical protein